MPGSTPGERRGGRKKGTPNKITVARRLHREAVAVRAAARGLMPLDVMVEYMHLCYQAGDMPTAHMAARDCAPYLHPRLSAAEVKVQQKPADQDEETSKRLAIEAFIEAFGPRKPVKQIEAEPLAQVETVLTNVNADMEQTQNDAEAAAE